MNQRRVSLPRSNRFINRNRIKKDNVSMEIKSGIENSDEFMQESNTLLEINNFRVMEGHYELFDTYEDDSNKYSISIGFIIVATGKYDIFVEPLIRSIEKYVLPNNKKYYNIFSDKSIHVEGIDLNVFKIEHRPFPYPTLKRFHFFDQYRDQIKGDQLAYIDADTLITENIGTEIITPITVTQHCGFITRIGTFETRENSSCYVHPRDKKNYFGGGFYSLSRDNFLNMTTYCKNLIDSDESIGIIPVWHDESALNKFVTTITPTRVLSPSYHYPQNHESIYRSWGNNGKETFMCKILLLEKNHTEIRS